MAAALAAVVAVVAACEPAVDPLDPSLGAAILTPEAADHYGLTVADGVVTAAAPTGNTGLNTRVAFWRAGDEATADHMSCASWVDPHGAFHQQGAALRVRSGDDRTTAITVTVNVLYGARWGFNVHVMDTAASPRFHKVAGFDLSTVFNPGWDGTGTPALVPYPWRLCARVAGDVVSFKAWPLAQAEPAWGDPGHGGSVSLPEGWDAPGRPGWYVGHLAPGDHVGFADLSAGPPGAGPGAGRVPAAGTPPPRAPTWSPEAP